MKKNVLFKTIFAAALGLSVVGFSVSNTKSSYKPIETDATAHTANFDSYTYSGSYYSSITSSLTEGMNGTLRSTLTSLIYPSWVPTYSGGSGNISYLSGALQYADEDPTNSSNMIYLYTRDSVTKNAASSWNREHVWPQSLSNGCWGQSKAGSDMLHLRPTYNDTNSKRGNDIYGNLTSGAVTYNGMSYGYSSGGKFCPLDSVKGDVARICMYVWVAYHDYYSSLPALTNVFESFDTLMSWHTSDKPDVMEGNRNNYCQSSQQGNRNPFVDHPEYAWKIFGSQCSTSVLNAAKAAYPENSVGITSISKTSTSLVKGNTTTISATSSNNGTISWSTSNSSVCTISANSSNSGANITLTAVAAGTATITASITISGTTYTKTCTVTVTNTAVTLTLNKSSDTIAVSGTTTITATASGGSGSVTWTTSSSTVATLSTTTGTSVTVTGAAAGSSTITATYSGQSATCVITVTSGGSSTYTRLTSISSIDSAAQYVLGTDGTGFHYSGTSSWGSTALPSAQTPLYYTLTANSGNTSFTAKTTINNTQYYLTVPTSNTFTMSTSSTNIKLGTTTSDSNGDPDYAVANTSTTTRHLRINGSSGLRSYAGTTGVMAYFYKVTSASSASLSLDKSSTSITSGNTTTITATASGGSGSVSWTTSNSSVASLSGSTGTSVTVTGGTAGTATITATYGGETATCTITVTSSTKTLSSITLNTTNVKTSFNVGETFTYSGLVVTANFSDSTSSTVTPTSVSSPDMSTTGNKTVTVSYTYSGTTKSASYNITVTTSGGQTTSATFTAGTDTGTHTGATGDQGEDSVTKNGITMSTSNGALAASGQYRVYSGATLTFSCSNNITSIVFTATGTRPVSALSTSTGTYTYNSNDYSGTWTGSATEVVFTASSQVRFSPVEVTVENSGGSDATTEASTWAATFVSKITCNATGSSTPTFATGYSWSQLATSYSSLSSGAKALFVAATYSVNGTTVTPGSGVNENVANCVAKYDYIVRKYGTSTYNNFMNRTIANSSNVVMIAGINDASTNLILAIFAIMSASGIIYFSLKKKHE